MLQLSHLKFQGKKGSYVQGLLEQAAWTMGTWLCFPALSKHVWSLSHIPSRENSGEKVFLKKKNLGVIKASVELSSPVSSSSPWAGPNSPSTSTSSLAAIVPHVALSPDTPSLPLTGQCILTLFLNRYGLKITPKIGRFFFYFNTWSKPGWHHWARSLLIYRKKRQILTNNYLRIKDHP